MFINKFRSLSIVIVIFLCLITLCSCLYKTNKIDVHIFSDIQECERIVDLKGDANVKIYKSSDKDKYLKNLEFQETFGCKYTSDDLTFELFAYEFSSSDIAMAYFENATGKGSDPNPTFLDSSGLSSYNRIVVSKNKAYAVYCKKSDKENVINFLNSCFSVDIKTETQGKEHKGTVLCSDG